MGLEKWREVFRDAYQNDNNDFKAQEACLELITVRTEWLIEEMKTWAESSSPRMWDMLLPIRCELHDTITCLENIRQHHISKSSTISRETQWMAYQTRFTASLPDVCRYELVLHRSSHELAEFLKELTLENTASSSKAPVRQAD